MGTPRLSRPSCLEHAPVPSDPRAASQFMSVATDNLIAQQGPPHGANPHTILEALRAKSRETFFPIIVLTADANENTKLRALRAGATDFLLKPFDQLEVLLRLTNLLETRRLHLQIDMKMAAFEDAIRERTSELREAQGQLQGVER